MSRAPKTFRSRYSDAIWAPNALRPNEKLVALTYIRYAGAKDPRTGEIADDDVSWVDSVTLAEHTGIRSRDTLHRALKALVEAGWMVQIEAARQYRSPRYRLTIPDRPDVRFTYTCDADTG
ncbi:hypothetical protein ACFFOS_27460 [Nocardioides kongjuensis]|uniref:Uncharacterized protein n=1 Tax=Nocardioides kongjuensis TaxID=349522 RepID=A0A852RSX4_9ACTN|nr:hypothetical protein [Nocardioides kongjuensis]NYD33859.1 hypothetical protein [Nocardioides kongjuensis]